MVFARARTVKSMCRAIVRRPRLRPCKLLLLEHLASWSSSVLEASVVALKGLGHARLQYTAGGWSRVSLRRGRGGAGTSRRGSAALVASHSSLTVAGRASGGIPSVAAPVGSEKSGCASPALHSSTCVRSGVSPCWRDALSLKTLPVCQNTTRRRSNPSPHSHQRAASHCAGTRSGVGRGEPPGSRHSHSKPRARAEAGAQGGTPLTSMC